MLGELTLYSAALFLHVVGALLLMAVVTLNGLSLIRARVDGRGNAFLNNTGFDFPGGEFAPRTIALVTPDGSAQQVADDRVARFCEYG